jgi:deoxycytidylate deaminase
VKPKHLAIRIEQCLSLSNASNCPRRKFGAMLLDPKRNVVLMDGYNGGPRGAEGTLCGGSFCERDGLKREDIEITEGLPPLRIPVRREDSYLVRVKGEVEKTFPKVYPTLHSGGKEVPRPDGKAEAHQYAAALLVKYPGVKSGTCMEVGCHHAEMNVVCNAAAGGVATEGAWLICTGEPCRMCSKLIHHSGIQRVYIIEGGYAGENGIEYLEKNGVEVLRVDGPKDPRIKA